MPIKLGCTTCFKALSIPSRMRIFSFLEKEGRSTVSQIVATSSLRQPTVSYHLREMEKAGLLKSEKSGKEVYYRVAESCPRYSDSCVLG